MMHVWYECPSAHIDLAPDNNVTLSQSRSIISLPIVNNRALCQDEKIFECVNAVILMPINWEDAEQAQLILEARERIRIFANLFAEFNHRHMMIANAMAKLIGVYYGTIRIEVIRRRAMMLCQDIGVLRINLDGVTHKESIEAFVANTKNELWRLTDLIYCTLSEKYHHNSVRAAFADPTVIIE